MAVDTCNASAGKQRQKDPGGSLVSQYSQLNELQAQQKILSQRNEEQTGSRVTCIEPN